MQTAPVWEEGRTQPKSALKGSRAPPGTPTASPRTVAFHDGPPEQEQSPWEGDIGKVCFVSQDPPEDILGKRQSEKRRSASWAERLFRAARSFEAKNLHLAGELERAHVQEQLIRSKIEDLYCRGEYAERALGRPRAPTREMNGWLRMQLIAYEDEVTHLRAAISRANAEADSAQVVECQAEQARLESVAEAERKKNALVTLKRRCSDSSDRLKEEEDLSRDYSSQVERLQAQAVREEQRLSVAKALAAEQPKRRERLITRLNDYDRKIGELKGEVIEPLWGLAQRLRAAFEAACAERMTWTAEVWTQEAVAGESYRSLQELNARLVALFTDVVERVQKLWSNLHRSWPLTTMDDAARSFEKEVESLRKEMRQQLADGRAQESRLDRQLLALKPPQQPSLVKPLVKQRQKAKLSKDSIAITSRLARGTPLKQVVADKTGGVKLVPRNVRVELGAFPRVVSREKSWMSHMPQSLAGVQQGFADVDLQHLLSIGWGFSSRAYALKPTEKPWRCFSLHTSSSISSLDLIADGDEVAMWWVVGLSLLRPEIAEVRTRGQFMWRRALMRIDAHCRNRAVTRKQALLKALVVTVQQRAADGSLPATERPIPGYSS